MHNHCHDQAAMCVPTFSPTLPAAPTETPVIRPTSQPTVTYSVSDELWCVCVCVCCFVYCMRTHVVLCCIVPSDSSVH